MKKSFVIFFICTLAFPALTEAAFLDYNFIEVARSSSANDGFSSFKTTSLNNSGNVAFSASLNNGVKGIFTSHGVSHKPVVTTADSFFSDISLDHIDINSKNALVFGAATTGKVTDLSLNGGIYRASGGNIATIAHSDLFGRTIAISSGTHPIIHDNSSVTFKGFDPTERVQRVLTGIGGETLLSDYKTIVDRTKLDAGDSFSGVLSFDSINESEVVFLGLGPEELPRIGPFRNFSSGLYAADGNETRFSEFKVADTDMNRDSSSVIKSFINDYDVNAKGQLVYGTRPVTGGVSFFLTDVYDGNKQFLGEMSEAEADSVLFDLAINEKGDVVLFSYVAKRGGIDKIHLGFDLTDDLLLSEGDVLFGDIVERITYQEISYNDLGQLSFVAEFNNGTSRVVLASPKGLGVQNPSTVPEPTTMAIVGLGLAGAGLIRRKKNNW